MAPDKDFRARAQPVESIPDESIAPAARPVPFTKRTVQSVQQIADTAKEIKPVLLDKIENDILDFRPKVVNADEHEHPDPKDSSVMASVNYSSEIIPTVSEPSVPQENTAPVEKVSTPPKENVLSMPPLLPDQKNGRSEQNAET